MGFARDEESALPPPTTIEELWARMTLENAKLRKEMREEGDPWLHDTVAYLRQLYVNYRKAD